MGTSYIELIVRLSLAFVLGGMIGLEREYRAKEAGFRTHFLVALGSALFCVVSQFGFGIDLKDSSRVAAQVVSGLPAHLSKSGWLSIGSSRIVQETSTVFSEASLSESQTNSEPSYWAVIIAPSPCRLMPTDLQYKSDQIGCGDLFTIGQCASATEYG